MSIKKEFSIASNQDNLPLHVCIMEPEAEAEAVVQLSHGMSEHKERYYGFMEFLCSHGYVCVIHDHRGHGNSIRQEDHYGYFYEDGAENLIKDLYQVGKGVRDKFSGLPFYLFGHSMGSLVARAYLKAYPKALDGLIVCGCPSDNPGRLAGKKLVELFMKQKGPYYRSEKLNQLIFGGFNGKFKAEGSPNSWLCSDKAVVSAYDESKKCGFVFTLNGFYNLFKLMGMVYSRSGWRVEKRQLPIWFLSGEEDPCMLSRAKFMEALSLLQYVGYENVTYCLYPGMRHEILNEIGKEKVFADILEKLKSWRHS